MDNININIDSVVKKDERIIYNTLKRFIDVVGSLFGLILLSPIIILVGILIKLESKGPIIFSQKRVGLISILSDSFLA